MKENQPHDLPPLGTVTFLFTDIQGSTQLLEKLNEGYAALLAEQRDLFRESFARWNGHEVDTQGDSFFVAFPRAVDALGCVIEVQKALAEHTWPGGVKVRVRMGLHTGDPIVGRTGYVGMDVHRAARIAASGHGGQVLLSQVTRDLVYQDLPKGIALRDLGEHKLKDIRYPQQIYQLEIDGLPCDFPPLKTLATEEEPPTPGDAPFKGMQYFSEADAHLFFGREQVTRRLVERITAAQFLAVIGASGSGKSSVVRAGVIPALKRGKTGALWRIFLLTPTAHPLESLAVALTENSESVITTISLIDDLKQESRTLQTYARRRVSYSEIASPFLVVVDQFEELFTLCRDTKERQTFVDNLLTAATTPDGLVHVLITLRADFYEHLAEYRLLRELVASCQEYLGAMSIEELRQVIEEPARLGDWEFSPGLVNLMLHEVGAESGRYLEPGALPLLSHALLETWKHRRGNLMNLKAYGESGGVRKAIAFTAENVYTQELTPAQQEIARGIFLRLTELGEGTQDTRRRATLQELLPLAPYGDPKDVKEVLRKLADARLIITNEDTVEVAHEALIREWPLLREWLEQDREGLRMHHHLTEAAQAWEKMNREWGELYRGVRLAQALDWAKTNESRMNPLERDFLSASKQLLEREEAEREAQRLEAIAQRDKAENERRTAFARELSVNALNNLAIDPERSILLSLQAISVSTTGDRPVLREAEEALHRAVQETRVQLALRGHTGAVHDVAFSPDGTRLATASIDRTAKIWDAETGKELLTLCCHADALQSIDFSPDGKRIATASYDKTAKIWDVETGKELLTLHGHTADIQGIAFSQDGSRVVTGSLDRTAKVWDAITGKLLLTLIGHTGGVDPVTFSPDGKRIATGSWNDELEHSVKIWDAESGQVLLTLLGHGSGIWGALFSPDVKRLVTSSGDGTIKIWDISSGQALMTLFPHTIPLSLALSSDGTHLAAGNNSGTAQIWDPSTGELLLTLPGHTSAIWGVSISPNGKRLASASLDGTARVWDITASGSREWLTIAAHPVQARYIAYNPNGTRVATSSLDKTVKVWDSSTGKLLLLLSGHSNAVNGIAYNPDDTRLATVSLDQTVGVWDAETGQRLLNIPTKIYPNPQGPRVAFSPDGKRIAAPGVDNTAKIWDAATGEELLTFLGHTGAVNGFAFSPDGSRLATGAWDRTAKVWDATTGKELITLSGHTDYLMSIKFSPDGCQIATASMDGTAKLWDSEKGTLLRTLTGHSGMVFDVAFSPDGKRLATASGDGTEKVWNISTPEEQTELPLTLYNGFGAMVSGVSFNADGTRLAASSNDGTARIYALPIDDIVAIAKSRLTRTLTTDECQKYLHFEQCPPDGTHIE